MNEKVLLPWLIVAKDGSILSAHCTCMAGCGESCSHVAAVAFMVSFQNSDNASCTEKLCRWSVPTAVQKVVPKRLKDIDWGMPIKTKVFNGKTNQILQI